MNYATPVINYLLQSEGAFAEVILAPGAPPVGRKAGGMAVITQETLTPTDVIDTLLTFRSHMTSSGPVAPDKDGTFSFGLQNKGRFRVSYFTQRGSYVVTIHIVPTEVPRLADLVAPCGADMPALLAALRDVNDGIVLVTGRRALANNTLVYAWLRHVADAEARLIFILEKSLSFLLRHQQAIIVQTELGTAHLRRRLPHKNPAGHHRANGIRPIFYSFKSRHVHSQ